MSDLVGLGKSHSTTSQCPPLAGPVRRIRASSRSLAICFSTARWEILSASAISLAGNSGAPFSKARILSELFSEPASDSSELIATFR